jgi:hypothetical protein
LAQHVVVNERLRRIAAWFVTANFDHGRQVLSGRQIGLADINQDGHGAVVVFGGCEVLHRLDGEHRSANRGGRVHLLGSDN